MKKVQITIELTSNFVRMLQVSCQMKGILPNQESKQLDALDLLGVLILGEARGQTEAELAMAVPLEWRNADVEPVLLHEKRLVIEK